MYCNKLTVLLIICSMSLNKGNEYCKEVNNSNYEPLKYFVKFGNSENDRKMREADDIYVVVDFQYRFKFFDKLFSNIYITNNGACYLNSINPNSYYRPSIFPIKGATNRIIAPFWADIDTRLVGGEVYYQLRKDDKTLRRIACDVQNAYHSFGNFKPYYALIVTWYRVRPIGGKNSSANNTFQLVMATNQFYSFVIFNYGDMDWPSNSAPLNSSQDFVSGYNLGDGEIYHLMKESFTNNISSLSSDSNVGIPSKWIFRVDSQEQQIKNFINFGSSMNDSLLEPSDESFMGPIRLRNEILISDKLTISSLFVYSNGFITFNQPYVDKPQSLPKYVPFNDTAMIFPFWSDINTGNNGDVFYREIKDNESLEKIRKTVNLNFKPKWAFVVTYYEVAPHGLKNDLHNTFQIVLASDETSCYAVFNYNKMSWPNLAFKIKVESGFNLDFDHYYLLSQINLVQNSNVNKSGTYVFRLDKPIHKTEENALIYEDEILINDTNEPSQKLVHVLIFLIVIIGLNSALNTFYWVWNYFKINDYNDNHRVFYHKERSDSRTILMHDEAI